MNRTAFELRGEYPTTIWSEVARAGKPDAPEALAALENLLRRYYPSLQAHLVFKFRTNRDEAADWLQEFVQRKVLLGHLLAEAAREKGRFRTFLLNALDNFVCSELRRAKAQKRKPEQGICALDELTPGESAALAREEPDPFSASWARIVLDQTLQLMETECERDGCAERWGVFKVRVLEPMLDGAEPMPYEEVVQRIGFSSPAEASNALITGKRMFHRLLRQVVAEYAGEGADMEDEIHELRRELGRVR